jgi:hypothetical protein
MSDSQTDDDAERISAVRDATKELHRREATQAHVSKVELARKYVVSRKAIAKSTEGVYHGQDGRPSALSDEAMEAVVCAVRVRA